MANIGLGPIEAALGGFVQEDVSGNGLWRSTDGSTWRQVVGVPGNDIRSDGTPLGGISLVCTVGLPAGSDEGTCADDAILRSVDGTHWRRLGMRIVGPHPGVGALVIINSAAANAGRFIAIGQVAGRQPRSVMLASTNGSTWRLVPGVPGRRGVNLFGVRSAGGGFIATGGDDRSPRVSVWTSVDGRVWTHGAVLPDVVQYGPQGSFPSPVVAAGGPGYVLAGTTRRGAAEVLTSVDGMHWSKAPEQTVFAGAWIGWMVSSKLGLIAAGSVGPIDEQVGKLTIWTSTDGLTWARAPDQPSPVMDGQGLATDGQRVVLLMCNLDTDCESWTSPLPP